MSISKYPPEYLDANTQQSKPLAVVVSIEGLPYAFALTNLYTRVRYGDAGLTYGMVGLVYGALRKLSENEIQAAQLTLESGLSIQQKIEPEQGKGSISSISLVFADTDGLLTQLCSPGVLLDEPLGGKEVKISLGFQNTSYPEAYFVVFRGTIGGTTIQGPRVTLQLVDPNEKSRQPVFHPANAILSNPMLIGDLTATMDAVGSFPQHIQGPDGSYDPTVRTFFQVDTEWMEYGPGAISGSVITVTRASSPIGRATDPASAHDAAATVTGAVMIGSGFQGGNPITLALKVMLSGWNGPWITGIAPVALGTTLDPSAPDAACIAFGGDVVEDFGLTVGDYITISGSLEGGNNRQVRITGFQADVGGRINRNVLVDSDLIFENPTPAVLAFRSQFDVLPVQLGARMTPREIDVDTLIQVRNWFFIGTENNMQFTLESEDIAKDFIEKELYFPIGAYSVTRYGRLSIGYTRPPIPGENLITVNQDNVIEPDKIIVSRALNTRRFYNYVTYDFDYDADQGKYLKSVQFYDLDSASRIKENSQLPVESQGMRSALGSTLLAQRRAAAFLTRFSNVAHEITITVNWEAGSQIETGDVILVSDNGGLKIANLATGTRDIGDKLYEVIDRTLDIKSDRVSLKLLGGIAAAADDRYGTITPSSYTDAGSSNTDVRIVPSFAKTFGANEWQKWRDYVGLVIAVHSPDFSQYGEAVLQRLDATTPNILYLATPLAFTPGAGYIVEVGRYPTDSDPKNQAKAKLLGAYLALSTGLTNFPDGLTPYKLL